MCPQKKKNAVEKKCYSAENNIKKTIELAIHFSILQKEVISAVPPW